MDYKRCEGGRGKAIEGVEGKEKELVLDSGVDKKSVKGFKEWVMCSLGSNPSRGGGACVKCHLPQLPLLFSPCGSLNA